ncbi:MAG: GNAT family N-acetyltransferase [Acidobacteria bacterium]|jgi:RimJ/RimL family protein N-acetyltransferase|nr:GNAT family N-acetyltransferase [Acidobacteriota bacterium]
MAATTATPQPVAEIEKNLTLKDGRQVTVRHLHPSDVERSYEFFCSLPEEDRKYLRVDVTRRRMVERRTTEIDRSRAERLVVVHDDEIVADGALELEGHGWGDNVAEIRLIVARNWQRYGLGTLLARELFHLASRSRVDRIIARLMRPQTGAHRILRRLGFSEEFLVPEHVRDQDGNWQDLIIMRCPLEDLWREMESEFETLDWRRHR